MKQPKTLFYCTECGNETPKWAGRCPACGAWNTVVERPEPAVKGKGRSASSRAAAPPKALPVTELGDSVEIRFSTGMGELDRVLGGGAVKGSLVLVGGAPGIGKSTLMLQICGKLHTAKGGLIVNPPAAGLRQILKRFVQIPAFLTRNAVFHRKIPALLSA